MGNCNRCERERDARLECPACHERFCERHRAPAAHECAAVRTNDGDAVGVIEESDGSTGGVTDAAPGTGESTGDASVGETPAEMDFDPTEGLGRLLRIAGVFAVVLLVSVLAAGVLWAGPGGGVLDLLEDTGTAAAPAPDDLNVTQVELSIHEQTNHERRDAGAEPLAYDDELAAIGAYHSRDMGENDYSSHTSPEGETIDDRYRQFGYTCEKIGEALQWVDYDQVDWSGNPEEALARTVVANWMGSDLHRSFVLEGAWSRQGVGVHVTDSGQVYVTLNTCDGS